MGRRILTTGANSADPTLSGTLGATPDEEASGLHSQAGQLGDRNCYIDGLDARPRRLPTPQDLLGSLQGLGNSFVYTYELHRREPLAMNAQTQSCQEKYWAGVAAAYGRQRMEELVRTYAQTCTRGRGYEIPDARNFGSMWGDAISGGRAQRDPARECITEAVFKVYSNIKSLGLS